MSLTEAVEAVESALAESGTYTAVIVKQACWLMHTSDSTYMHWASPTSLSLFPDATLHRSFCLSSLPFSWPQLIAEASHYLEIMEGIFHEGWGYLDTQKHNPSHKSTVGLCEVVR